MQDRIRTSLDAITSRLDSLATTYHNAHEGLDQIVGVLTDLDDLYSRCQPAERRILNRALFTRIVINEDEHTAFVAAEPVASVITHAHAARPTSMKQKETCPALTRGRFRISQLTWS